MKFSVVECLRAYTDEALATLCEYWGLAATTKTTRLRAVERILSDPLHVEPAVRRLSDTQRRALHLVRDAGKLCARELLEVPGLIGGPEAAKTLHSLASGGFVLAWPQERAGPFHLGQLAQGARPTTRGPTLIVPATVQRALTECPPVRLAIRPAAPSAPESTPEAFPAQMDFLETLRLIELIAPRMTAGGEVHKGDMARLREAGREPGLSSEALAFSTFIGRELGCVQESGGRLVTTREADAWAEEATGDRARLLLRGYCTSPELVELQLFFPELVGAMEAHLPRGTLRRTYHKQLAASALAGLEPAQWYVIDDFIDSLRSLDPNVLFLTEPWRAIAAGAHGTTKAWLESAWQSHEKRLFSWMIQHLLAWMGVVGLSGDGRWFRVTDVGRYALGAGPLPGDSSIEASGNAVVVQPDFEAIVYADRCPPSLRRKLDRYADRVRSGPVMTYRLGQDSVYRGMRSGGDIDGLLDALERHSEKPIPDNVRRQLSSWDRKAGFVTVHAQCRLLEFVEPAQAAAFAGERNDAQRIGDRYVLIDGPAPDLSARIRYDRPLGRPFVQGPGLRLCAPWESATLFAQRALAGLAQFERLENGDLVAELRRDRVDPDAEWGLLAAQVEAVVQGPLAARYRTALRAWCGEPVESSARAAMLVRFDEPEACDAALELPGVSDWVEGRLGLNTLVLRPGRLAAFRKALRGLGLNVSRNHAVLDDGPPEAWAGRWSERQQTRDDAGGLDDAPLEAPAEVRDEDVVLPSYAPKIMGEIIQDAINRRRSLLIQYQNTWSARPGLRKVNPVSVDLSGPQPTLNGHCHVHGGARSFKLSRITGIRVLEDERF